MKISQMLLVCFLVVSSSFCSYESINQEDLYANQELFVENKEVLALKKQVASLKKEVQRLLKALNEQNKHVQGGSQAIAIRSTELSRQLGSVNQI